MKKAYLAISYQNRKHLSAEIETIKTVLANFKIELFVFVDNYHFTPAEEKQMMQQAFSQIVSSDLLIAEVSEKAIGAGIEIGYAAALNKPILYLRNNNAEHSTTASGSAGYSLMYHDLQDLTQKLKTTLLILPF